MYTYFYSEERHLDVDKEDEYLGMEGIVCGLKCKCQQKMNHLQYYLLHIELKGIELVSRSVIKRTTHLLTHCSFFTVLASF